MDIIALIERNGVTKMIKNLFDIWRLK